MRARTTPVGVLTFALALSAIGLGACSGNSNKPSAAPATSTSTPAPRVTTDPASSPFTSKTAFCTKDTAKHTGLTASAPGVTADSISVVAIEPPLSPGDSPQGYQFNLGDPVDMLKVFAKMVNDCGGINGRDIKLTVVQQKGGAADQATTVANAQAACIQATEDNKPFIVLSWTGMFAAPFWERFSNVVLIKSSP